MNTPSAELSESPTLVETAYGQLRRDIIAGTRQPGERLRIERLKAIYGIGPTPLREALQKLAQDGLVVTEGNRGFTVAPLDAAEFADLNIARTAIEKEALRLSIAQGDDGWESRVVAASYIMAKEDAALAAADGGVPDAWERANEAFHGALVSASGSAWLLRVRAGLAAHCERYRRTSVYQRRRSRDLGAEHAQIARAALDRDAETACALIERHFALTATMLRDDAGPAPQAERPGA